MGTAGTRNWQLQLESNWEAEESPECLTISRIGGVGPFQISAAIEDAAEIEPHEIGQSFLLADT